MQPRSNQACPQICFSRGGKRLKWVGPSMGPARKPSFSAVASSWMEVWPPYSWSASIWRGARRGPRRTRGVSKLMPAGLLSRITSGGFLRPVCPADRIVRPVPILYGFRHAPTSPFRKASGDSFDPGVSALGAFQGERHDHGLRRYLFHPGQGRPGHRRFARHRRDDRCGLPGSGRQGLHLLAQGGRLRRHRRAPGQDLWRDLHLPAG